MNAALLSRRNDWWSTGKSTIGSAYELARNEIDTVIGGLGSRRIQLIIGPRRVGKSVLMHQVIGRLLSSGTEPRRILFFSCDDPTLFGGDTTIGDVIDEYLDEVLHETATDLGRRVYVFIDEVHMYHGWQLWLKNYYEPQYNMKFIVSGSSASHLFTGSKESLLGRTDTLRMLPISFNQFCRFWSRYRESKKVSEFLDEVPGGSVYDDPSRYYDALAKDAWRWDRYKPYVMAAMQEYLIVGGYPEYFTESSPLLWQKRLVDDVIGQGLYRDIVSTYKIKATDKLERLLYFIADNNGQDFNMKTIADTIGCDNETVSAYLTYLSQAYMVIVLNSYSPNVGKSLRKNRTLFVLDNGIANALLRVADMSDARAGRIVESICARDALAICEQRNWGLNYWREKGIEVDLVIDRRTDALPVEVKYRSNAGQTSLQAFRQAFPNAKSPVGVVITKDRLSAKDETLHIPFWLTK